MNGPPWFFYTRLWATIKFESFYDDIGAQSDFCGRATVEFRYANYNTIKYVRMWLPSTPIPQIKHSWFSPTTSSPFCFLFIYVEQNFRWIGRNILLPSSFVLNLPNERSQSTVCVHEPYNYTYDASSSLPDCRRSGRLWSIRICALPAVNIDRPLPGQTHTETQACSRAATLNRINKFDSSQYLHYICISLIFNATGCQNGSLAHTIVIYANAIQFCSFFPLLFAFHLRMYATQFVYDRNES